MLTLQPSMVYVSLLVMTPYSPPLLVLNTTAESSLRQRLSSLAKVKGQINRGLKNVKRRVLRYPGPIEHSP